MSNEQKARLLDLWKKATSALADLSDYWLEVSDGNWKPAYGLIGGCIEQMGDVWDEMMLGEADQ